MTTIKATVRGGQLELQEPIDLPDGTELLIPLPRAEQFERLTGARPQPSEQPHPEIPPLLLRSQQAFWRDLPALLQSRRTRGCWVAYHGDERIGIAATDDALIRECLRRNLHGNDYYLDVIEPMTQPPWLLVEEVDHGLAEPDAEPAPPSP